MTHFQNSNDCSSEEIVELEPELQEDGVKDIQSQESDITHPFDPTKIQILSKQDTLLNLITRLKNDEIDMNTDFQRHAELWSSQQMSRLIESILIRFPLPAFYFDASNDEKWLVVDGLQRLSTIRKFVVEQEPSAALRLSGLEYLTDLNGKSYSDLLRPFKRRIDECPVTLFLIQPGTPDDVKYGVFKRINTGGLVLNNQEIRNALAKERERKFLSNLAQDPNLIKTMGNQSKRMIDQELVLRFLAFYQNDYLKNPKNIAAFLDEEMENLKKASEFELEKLAADFRRTIKYCAEIFGEQAFEKRNGEQERRKRKNSSLMEVWTVQLAKLSDSDAMKLVDQSDLVKSKLQELTNSDPIFFQAISMATQKRENVRLRHEGIRKIIDEVLHA